MTWVSWQHGVKMCTHVSGYLHGLQNATQLYIHLTYIYIYSYTYLAKFAVEKNARLSGPWPRFVSRTQVTEAPQEHIQGQPLPGGSKMAPAVWGSKFTAKGLVVTVTLKRRQQISKKPQRWVTPAPVKPQRPPPPAFFWLLPLGPACFPPPSLPLALSIKIVYKSK